MDKDVSALQSPPSTPKPPKRWERRYEARIALDAKTKRDAYALRYESYFAEGFIAANSARLFPDEYDALPSVTTIVVYQDGSPVGSIRTCKLSRATPSASPAGASYPSEVASILEACEAERRPCYEVNRLVRAPHAADDQGLVFMLIRLADRFAQLADFGVTISCVRSNHVAFYRRLRYVVVGPPKIYPGLNCEMTLLKLSRSDWEIMRRQSRLLDPEAGPPGLLDGLEQGCTVLPALHRAQA